MTNKLLAAALAALLAMPAFAAEVDRRLDNQQQRIAQGARSGELTPRETARLERKEAKIKREIRNDRAANGGRLTNAEKRKINREEDRASRKIHRAKHNAKRA